MIFQQKPKAGELSPAKLAMILRTRGIGFSVSDEICDGPRTRAFELTAGPQSSIAKLRKAAEDVALDLGVESITIERDGPALRMVVAKRDWKPARIRNLVAKTGLDKGEIIIGISPSGEIISSRLADDVHYIIGGCSGSGKSVLLHSMIYSMIARHTKQQLRLVLIDPKQVEFGRYKDLPHLAAPIVRDPQEAMWLLEQLVIKMNTRYKKMATGESVRFPIVVVIDEFADLVSGPEKKAIFHNVQLLAQKARAARIHLILATQRPSVQVIPGLIKANFPARVCLKTSSIVDSKVILDIGGGEKLLGKGDMLWRSSSNGRPTRLQAPLADSFDTASLVEYYERGDERPPMM